MPTAIEEFLRAYAPVTMAREVVKETTVGGCPFKEKGQVLLSFPAANRDPAEFVDADKVLIDRTENRHAAFGLGRHRCLGSNLARLEMTVAIGNGSRGSSIPHCHALEMVRGHGTRPAPVARRPKRV
jgi:cytochrome P450